PPDPTDLEPHHKSRVMYWTDRGDPPRGNTVNRASIDNKPAEPEIVVTHLMEGIGIALDVPNDRMFVTDFAGSVYSARLDGSGERNFLYAQGNLTGIAYAEVGHTTHRKNDMPDTKPIRRIAIIGTGVIGASWSALYLAKGLQVVATDVAPNAEAALRKFVEAAWPALKRLGLSAGGAQSNLRFTAALA